MEQRIVMDALVLAKRLGNQLDEVLDLSRQMAEAVDRGDEVVIQMLLSMRAEPIRNLQKTDRALHDQRENLPQEEGDRLAGLLNGTAQPENREEEMLLRQAESNRRLHRQVMDLERILNKKIARDKSIY